MLAFFLPFYSAVTLRGYNANMKITKIIYCIFISILYSSSLLAELIVEASIKALHFNYEEFDQSGKSFNEEDGVIPGLSLVISGTTNQFTNSIGFEAYDGRVDYDGMTQSGIPLTSKTDETLYRLFYRLDWSPENHAVTLYGKTAWQQWDRDIQSTGITSSLFERYQWWTLEAGAVVPLFTDDIDSWQFEFGILNTTGGTIEIDLSRQGFGKPVLNLGSGSGLTTTILYQRKLTGRSELGLNLQYQHWKFGRSNTETISNNVININITEPRSVSQHTTLSLNYRYRL